jgi:uncharacterized membrane protein (DUF485 family)
MGGLDHGPHQASPPEDASLSARNARYGVWLFAVYLAFYAAFVLLNAFRPQVMDITPAAGINLAVLYGFGLIVAAFALALVYAWLCRAPSRSSQPEDAA